MRENSSNLWRFARAYSIILVTNINRERGGEESMNIWHDISPERIKPEDFISVIEIPKGCKNKYEVDKEGTSRRSKKIRGGGTPRIFSSKGELPENGAEGGT